MKQLNGHVPIGLEDMRPLGSLFQKFVTNKLDFLGSDMDFLLSELISDE